MFEGTRPQARPLGLIEDLSKFGWIEQIDPMVSEHGNWLIPILLLASYLLLKTVIGRTLSVTNLWQTVIQAPCDTTVLATSLVAGAAISARNGTAALLMLSIAGILLTILTTIVWRCTEEATNKEQLKTASFLFTLNAVISSFSLVAAINLIGEI